LRTVVDGKPNENFVTDLLTRTDGEPSQYLTRLTEDFSRLCGSQQQPWRIVSYYERLKSPTLSASASKSHGICRSSLTQCLTGIEEWKDLAEWAGTIHGHEELRRTHQRSRPRH
jgi:hypothetical protein